MCPPHSDQTMRGPQRWQVIAPRLRQIETLSPEPGCDATKVNVLFDASRSWDAWNKLAVNPSTPPFIMNGGDSEIKWKRSSTVDSCAKSQLEGIPAEMLAMILTCEALSERDIINLGLCSHSLWSHVSRHIQGDLMRAAAPWAGVELACTGTYLQDLPPAFERDGLVYRSVDTSRFRVKRSMAEARKANWAAVGQYDKPDASAQKQWKSAIGEAVEVAGHSGKFCQRLSMSLCIPTLNPSLCGNDSYWIVRNLTTKEYIRLTAREDDQVHLDGEGCEWLGLEDILYTRICWTMVNPHRPDSVDQKPRRGCWAGHAFKIEMVPRKEAGLRDWRDVTDEILLEANRIRDASSSHSGRDYWRDFAI